MPVPTLIPDAPNVDLPPVAPPRTVPPPAAAQPTTIRPAINWNPVPVGPGTAYPRMGPGLANMVSGPSWHMEGGKWVYS
jgi:hypothetical protein